MLFVIFAAYYAANLKEPTFHLADDLAHEPFLEPLPPIVQSVVEALFESENEVVQTSNYHSRISPSSPASKEVSRLEYAIHKLAFNQETTRYLQEHIKSGGFSANEVSLVSNDVLVGAMSDPHANFVVFDLIENFPEIMFYKIGTKFLSMFENTRVEKGRANTKGFRFLIAFLKTGNSDIEDKIFSQMSDTGTLYKFLLKRQGRFNIFPIVILKFVNTSKWADKIAIHLLQKRPNPKYYLPAIMACSAQHHLELIQANGWIAENVSPEEAIKLEPISYTYFDKSSRSFRALKEEEEEHLNNF